jgi:hypothetical protein
MLRLEGALDERKKAAEAQVAMAEAVVPGPPEPGRPAQPKPPLTGSAVRPPPQPAAAQIEVKKVAVKNLERVAQAEALLAAARMSPPAVARVPEPAP